MRVVDRAIVGSVDGVEQDPTVELPLLATPLKANLFGIGRIEAENGDVLRFSGLDLPRPGKKLAR